MICNRTSRATISRFPQCRCCGGVRGANELSDNAIYNDQISVCDSNGDSLVSTQEAVAYRSIVVAQISEAEKNKLPHIAPRVGHDRSGPQPAPAVPQTTPPGPDSLGVEG